MREKNRTKHGMLCLMVILTVFWPMTEGKAAQGDGFPKQVGYEIYDADAPTGFDISDAAEYVFQPYLEDFSIVSPQLPRDILLQTSGPYVTAGWSASNQHIGVALIRETLCPSGVDQVYMVIFSTMTWENTGICFPLDMVGLNLAWSPFSDNILFADETWLIDLEKQTITRHSAEDIKGLQADRFVGYGRYFWDPKTQQPAGVIDLHTVIFSPTPEAPFAPVQPATIENAWFEYCELAGGTRLNCQPLLDVTAHYPAVFVYDWQIVASNMLVWLGVETNSAENLNVSGVLPTQYIDSVVYMTDLRTLETREIFRLSQLRMEDVSTKDLASSPDSNTIALNLFQQTGPYSGEEKLLVLDLEW